MNWLDEENQIFPIEGTTPESEELKNLKTDYQIFSKELSRRLDSNIRFKLRKQGLTVSQNIYTGFDTEYASSTQIPVPLNKILSAQLAVTTRTRLKLPILNADALTFNLDLADSKFSDPLVPELDSLIKENPDSILYQGFSENDVKSQGRRSLGLDREKSGTLLREGLAFYRYKKYNIYDNAVNHLIESLNNQQIPFTKKEDSITFVFPFTKIRQLFIRTENSEYTLKELVKSSKILATEDLETSKNELYKKLKEIHLSFVQAQPDQETELQSRKTDESMIKTLDFESSILTADREKVDPNIFEGGALTDFTPTRNSRSWLTSFTTHRASVSQKTQIYLILHNAAADLSILNDFSEYKNDLTIVNKCYVTLGDPISVSGMDVHIRDTQLIAPGGSKSLQAVSKLYKNIEKIEVTESDISDMEGFWHRDKESFIRYAEQDALITLIHGCTMEDFNHKLGGTGVPLTLSTLSGRFLSNDWTNNEYPGYQISPSYLLGDAGKVQTPRGLFVTKDIGLKLAYFTGNFKGGRNETFMYGIDEETTWYDYDLVSAYTTVMAMIGDPDYSNAKTLSTDQFKDIDWKELVLSFTIIDCNFSFPKAIKYPSIPCFIDETTTVYPLKGSALLTGAEYIVALEQGCYFDIKEIVHIPFVKEVKPFYSSIQKLQELRAQYPKGTIYNALYKELGNSLYGLTARGIGGRKRFDVRMNKPIKAEVNAFANPLICSWITALTRSIMGELLHLIACCNHKAVSVTTDGFVTDLANIENLYSLDNMDDNIMKKSIFKLFKDTRLNLSGKSFGLELKNKGTGILSWKTRGQFSSDAKIFSITGLQRRSLGLETEQQEEYFKEILNSEEKRISYLASSLRSAVDIHKKGGHVSMVFKDQYYSFVYDNKRNILDNTCSQPSFHDSRPLVDIEQAKQFRFIASLNDKPNYHKHLEPNITKKYKTTDEIAVRNFIKALFADELNLDSKKFKSYSEIAAFIKDYNKFVISENYIANLKRRKNTRVKIKRTKEVSRFIEYVKSKFPDFDATGFVC